MKKEGFTVDTRSVLRMFAALSPKRQKRAHRMALKKGLGILVKETRKNLRSVVNVSNKKSWINGKTLSSGINSKVNRNVTAGTVDIYGYRKGSRKERDNRLIYFEIGTKIRRTTGQNNLPVKGREPKWRQHKSANRGKINARYFFKKARESKEAEISASMDQILKESILKTYGQFKNR